MRRILLPLAISSVILAAVAMPLAAAASDNDISKVNGTVQVDAGQHAGDVSSVNGSVHIGDGAVVQEASTVNGSLDLGAQAHASKLGTVNGAIRLADGSQVDGTVEAVNGAISLARGAQVNGHLSNVNGGINLDNAHVAGGLETVAGDITVGANSHVEGGILVDQPHNGWFHFGSDHKPTIVIGPHAVVRGTLEFRREVVLKVSESAQIGPVKGATVEKFSGAAP
ncbi:hypothetical protein IHE49_17425 [Rhodanobacter sp. 7MK24]|uniref:hypothetical protein n=1 Tax=Rhodanobacter sp. 7MK24 TaxID=2775922 RepID=UPI001784E5E7|nr:hypothetical protein [Rhodanobacter sp. 7MK24]MBD8882266.1 hypothetical protein [Rhodanobacter sp. 7MK24]